MAAKCVHWSRAKLCKSHTDIKTRLLAFFEHMFIRVQFHQVLNRDSLVAEQPYGAA